MSVTPATLAANGIIRPASRVWRVRFVFLDGTERVICISPGGLDEESAVARAKRHAGILDASVLNEIDAQQVQRDLQASPFGMVAK